MDSPPGLGKTHAILLSFSVVLLIVTLLVGFLWMRSDFFFLVLVIAPLTIASGFFGGLIGGYGVWSRFKRQYQANTGMFLDRISPGYLAFWGWVGILLGIPLGIITFQGATWIEGYFAIFDSPLIFLFIFVVVFLLIAVIPGSLVFLTIMILDWNIRPWFKDRKIVYPLIATSILLLLCLSTIQFTLRAYNFQFSRFEDAHTFSDQTSRWFLLPKPPTEVVRLISIRPFTIFVQTTDGKVFGCTHPTELDANCWYEVNSLPREPESVCEPSLSYEFPEPPQNIEIIQELQKEYCDYWFAGDYIQSSFQYLLSENGEIWQWGSDNIGLVETPEFNRAREEIIREAHGRGLLLGSFLTSLTVIFAILIHWLMRKLKPLAET